jgi:cell division protein FtsW (lipid II flippase)
VFVLPEKIVEYLKATSEQIRWKRARPVLISELQTHLIEQKDAYIAQGMDEMAAEAEALRQMGDPITVGQELDWVHRPIPQWGFLILTGLLALAGGALRVLLSDGPGTYAPAKTIACTLLGFACLLGGYFLDYTIMGRYAGPVYWGTVLIGVGTLILSPSINGVYYYAGYVVILFPVVYAMLLYSLRGKGWDGLVLAVAGGIPLMIIAMLTPSVLGVFLLFITAFILLLTAIWKHMFNVRRGLAAGFVIGLAVVGTTLFLLSHWQGIHNRLMVALHPALDAYNGGYQASVILETLSGAELWGEGILGGAHAGSAYWRVMPGAERDFLLTTLIHYLGWIPFLLLCSALLGLLIWAAIKCHQQANALGRMVALSIVLTIGIQIAFSILRNLGFVLVNSTCPFVAGNLHSVLDMALMGLLLSVFRQEALPTDSKAATFASGRHKLISWQDGNLVIALNRRNHAQ